MSWLYLPVQVAGFLEAGSSDGEPSATSKTNPIASKSSKQGSGTDTSTTPQSGMTPGHSTGDPGLDLWTSSLRASHANPSVSPEKAPPNWMNAISGRTPFALLENVGLNGSYWRTYQASLASLTSDEFSQTWPKAGSMSGGIAFQQRGLERRIFAKDNGLWPTATARPDGSWQWNGSHNKKTLTLLGKARLLPTPSADDAGNVTRKSGQFRSLTRSVMFPTPKERDILAQDIPTATADADTVDGLHVAASTYTPALTNVTNVAASTAFLCQWVQIGDMVTVSGRVDIDPTALGFIELGMALPVASNFASGLECGGTAVAKLVTEALAISADTVNNRAVFQGVATDTANRAYSFSFTYRVV